MHQQRGSRWTWWELDGHTCCSCQLSCILMFSAKCRDSSAQNLQLNQVNPFHVDTNRLSQPHTSYWCLLPSGGYKLKKHSHLILVFSVSKFCSVHVYSNPNGSLSTRVSPVTMVYECMTKYQYDMLDGFNIVPFPLNFSLTPFVSKLEQLCR